MDTNMDVAVSSVHPRGKQHAMHLPGKLRVLIERNTMVGSNLLHRLDLVLSITCAFSIAEKCSYYRRITSHASTS